MVTDGLAEAISTSSDKLPMFRPRAFSHFSQVSARSLMECRTYAEPSSAASVHCQQWRRERCSQAVPEPPLARSWTHVASSSKSPSFSILSYNVLSDKLLHKNMHLYERSLAPLVFTWGYRSERLLSEILSYDCDVGCS